MLVLRLLLVFLVVAILAIAALFGWAHSPITLKQPEIEVAIKPGSGVFSIAHQLNQNGVKVQTKLFGIWAKMLALQQHRQAQAGTYAIQTGMSPHQILLKMMRGDIVRINIVIVEGWDFKKMRAVINAHPRLTHDTLNMNNIQLLNEIGADYFHPEGLFFPDTYIVSAGSSDLEIFKQAYQAGQKHLNEIWQTRAPNLPYQHPYQALIMASIIEKETGQASDRSLIAAVFLNRLKLGMRLQTDPTIIYGMGSLFTGNLRKKDLLQDTPYNTYTRMGLPPTPISLPGKDSLIAAMHPAETSALFFVARGDGSSAFSSNLADHSRAVNQFQRTQNISKKASKK